MNLLCRFSVCVLLIAMTGGCTTVGATYDQLPPGELKGKLLVRWIEPDTFLFIPDNEDPLVFTRSNGDRVMPGRMLTDGGSIPRPLWILRSYSPWGYAPAFVVHDWLFEMKHCRLPGHEQYTHRIAADVMGEVMKTMMISGKVAVDKPTLWSMHAAVSSGISGDIWKNGECTPPPIGMDARKPLAEYVISFP
ncbi:DUF1353 domain-containing protein [Pseudoxanthomonas mexicana]